MIWNGLAFVLVLCILYVIVYYCEDFRAGLSWTFRSAKPIFHDLPAASSSVFDSASLFAFMAQLSGVSLQGTNTALRLLLQSALQSAGTHLRLFGFFDLLWLVCLAHVVKRLQ
jgi:hypothetical protein